MPVLPSKPAPSNLSTSELVESWKAGQIGSPPAQAPLDGPDPLDSQEVESPEQMAAKLFSPTGQSLQQDEATSEPSETSEEVSPPSDTDLDATAPSGQPQASNIKHVTKYDAQGRKTKVPVDLSKTDEVLKSIEKMYALEKGMREFQSERDKLKVSNTERDTQANHFKAISDAYAKNGLAGIVNYIEGDDTAYGKVEKSINERYDIRRTATPAERSAMDEQERIDAERREMKAEREANQKFRQDIEAQREASEVKQLESLITPSFEKHNFTGKLGNKESEQLVNKMIWNTAMEKLEALEGKGLELTSAEIDSIFKEVSSTFRSVVKSQVDSKTKAVVEAKKQAATESAQTRVMSGNSNTTDQQRVAKMLQSNDVKGLVRNFFGSKG